jgi:hypothetical protein
VVPGAVLTQQKLADSDGSMLRDAVRRGKDICSPRISDDDSQSLWDTISAKQRKVKRERRVFQDYKDPREK